MVKERTAVECPKSLCPDRPTARVDAMRHSLPRVISLLFLLGLCAVLGCTSFRRTVGIPNTFRVLPSGHPELEAQVKKHLESYVFSSFFQRRKLGFSGDVLIKTAPAVRKDRLGVPFYASQSNTRDRSGGLTLFTGRNRPVVLIIALLPDGTWDERTLKHECCHVILLWNGINGHPSEFRSVAPLWH